MVHPEWGGGEKRERERERVCEIESAKSKKCHLVILKEEWLAPTGKHEEGRKVTYAGGERNRHSKFLRFERKRK